MQTANACESHTHVSGGSEMSEYSQEVLHYQLCNAKLWGGGELMMARTPSSEVYNVLRVGL